MSRKISVHTTKEELINEALNLIIEKADEAIQAKNSFTIALAGGNTPKPLYEKLAATEQDWSKWNILWGDERFVDPQHPDSNERMARSAWLNHVSIPEGNIHPLRTAFATPNEAAVENDSQLKNCIATNEASWPSIDLALLGMGDDGHTASLFPGTPAIHIQDRWVTVGMKDDNPRLTLTVPVFNQSQNVVFLIAGENKNPVLKEIFDSNPSQTKYPVELIQPQQQAWWMLDASAAQNLKP